MSDLPQIVVILPKDATLRVDPKSYAGLAEGLASLMTAGFADRAVEVVFERKDADMLLFKTIVTSQW